EIVTPLIDHPLIGKVFLGQPTPTQLLRLFVDIEDGASGLKIKLPGVSTPDPATGQLTTVFDNLPQVPFTSFALAFRGAAKAILSNRRTAARTPPRRSSPPGAATPPPRPATAFPSATTAPVRPAPPSARSRRR